MDKKDIAEVAVSKELETLEIILSSKVEKSYITLQEYIDLRLAQGTAKDVIIKDLTQDLEEGGRIFGEFRNAIKSSLSGSLGRFRDAGELAELGLEGKWRWVTVNTKNPCPDCTERHGMIKTWNEWEEIGVPRANATVCEQHCKCILVSAEAVEIPIITRG